MEQNPHLEIFQKDVINASNFRQNFRFFKYNLENFKLKKKKILRIYRSVVKKIT